MAMLVPVANLVAMVVPQAEVPVLVGIKQKTTLQIKGDSKI
jgi:hypothetical protein